jgi:hypothetical protein
MRWPGHIRGGQQVAEIAGAIDLLPTLSELARVPIASKKPLDGKSLVPLFSGGGGAWPDRMIFSLQNHRISVRTQQYRLDPNGALFDMVADPGQERDIAKEKPDVAAKLSDAVDKWGKEMLPLVGRDDRPFLVGYAPLTMLPARDGVGAGNIERSAAPPNCSFFTNWISRDDRITWDIEVGQAGTYTAEVYYTCGAKDVGSTIELSFDDTRVQTKVGPAFDPPLIGKEFDRVPRTESYVKDWRPLRLGTMQLKKTRGKLTLRALDIAGKQVADVRWVMLTRV